ncbi:hypothetical protein [uncultured Erythrobacter sp.]|uniref:SecDF P1 head subdomain-containing protein n=1 Tax=uncultured Erythrobacter sp. TaxID=263913 RepID=UPI00261F000E|nr:hypothetical protein [uncultured Erythrobacter sp.]
MARIASLIAFVFLALTLSSGASAQTPTPRYDFVFEADLDHLNCQSEVDPACVEVMSDSLDSVGLRLDAIGGLAYQLDYYGGSQIRLILIDNNAPQIARDVFGITGDVSLRLVEKEISDVVPYEGELEGTEVLRMADEMRAFLVRKDGGVTAKHIAQAKRSVDETNGEVSLVMQFDDEGRARLARMSRDNVGKAIAIVVDGAVVSAPIIHETIVDGNAQLNLGFGADETLRLAIVLSTMLPLEFTLVDERRVSPEGAPNE